MNHLNALELNLSNERVRLSQSKTQQEVDLRRVFVQQLEKEILGERKFLGLVDPVHVSDDELLEELGLS
jgi:hypothetical protein